MKEIQHGNEHECKEICTFYILSSTSTNFNDFIFESSSEGTEDHEQRGFFGEQTDQRRECFVWISLLV